MSWIGLVLLAVPIVLALRRRGGGDLSRLPGLYRSGRYILGSLDGFAVRIRADNSPEEPWLSVVGASPRFWLVPRKGEGGVTTGDARFDAAFRADGDALRVTALLPADTRSALLELAEMQVEVGEGALRLWFPGRDPEKSLRAALALMPRLAPGDVRPRAEEIAGQDPDPQVRALARQRCQLPQGL